MTVKQITIGVFASFALLTGCEDAAKMGADAAIKTGEAAIGAVKADAEKYIPGDAKSLTDALAKAKDAFAKQDYAGALAGAKELAEKAKDLGPAAMKAKEQLIAGWSGIASSVPKMMEQVEARAGALSKAGKLPPGAGDKLAAAKKSWDDASAAFKSGNFAEAMSKANSAKNDLTEVAGAVGVKMAAATK